MEALGYFGVIVPGKLNFQGYLLVDQPELHDGLNEVRERFPDLDIHTLGALLLDAHQEQNAYLISTCALGISQLLGTPFFRVQGMFTDEQIGVSIDPIEAKTIEEAREAFQRDPLVTRMSGLSVVGPTSIN